MDDGGITGNWLKRLPWFLMVNCAFPLNAHATNL